MPHGQSVVAPGQQRHEVARPGVGLVAVAVIACVAQFMVVLDASIVNVALPAMKQGLGLSVDAQQWVVNGYLITFGGFLLLASRAGDLLGRRRSFLLGLGVFTAASLFGGLAQDGWLLVLARVVQGAGAAALAPASLSLITASHAAGRERTRAMTWWGAAASGAGAAGVVLGGLLTASFSWRWVMLVNVPIGAGLLLAAIVLLRPSVRSGDGARIDVPGPVAVTLATAALVYGVSAAPEAGWASGRVVAALLVGVVLMLAFVLIERRSDEPLIPRELFAVHNVRVGNVLTVLLGTVLTAPLFFLSLYLQQVQGVDALRAGLSLLPMTVVVSAGVLVSQRLIPAIGSGRLVLLGGMVAAAGLVWLARLPVHADYAADVLAPTVVLGAGTSLTMMPAIVAATTGVAARNAGIASGLMNMCRQLGAALGLAVLVTVASTVTGRAGGSGTAALADGYRVALLAIAVLSTVTALLSFLLREPGVTHGRA